MHTPPRPLSPHLQVYRLPVTAILSILHRMTGVLLSLALPVAVAWLATAAFAPDWYETLRALFASLPGQILTVAWLAALYLHLCNGVRHLFWDTGRGFDLRTVDVTSAAVIAATLILTGLNAALFLWG